MRYDNDPTCEELYCVPIIRPRNRHPICFTVCVQGLRGCWTHWFGGKTIACNYPMACPPCDVNVKRTWAGHVLCYRHEDDQLCMAVFTKPTKTFFKGHEDPVGSIMGISCRLVRMGGRDTGPVAAVYLGRDVDRTEQKIGNLEKIMERLYADNANQRKVTLR